jgi:tRNA dimethylallyltransferase
MLREIENLHKESLSWKRMEAMGLEYRYGSQYLQKKISKNEMIEKINTETWHYAKRQKTWFKRDQNIIWINPLKKSDTIKALQEAQNFLK